MRNMKVTVKNAMKDWQEEEQRKKKSCGEDFGLQDYNKGEKAMTKKRKKATKRRNLTKNEILFKMRCNEVAMKNINGFMSGEITFADLLEKVKQK